MAYYKIPLYWPSQVFLEQLPKDIGQWAAAAKARRVRYQAMRDGYLASPTDMMGPGTSEDWSVNNPLSEAAEVCRPGGGHVRR
jgi:hypothetical protein